ncbi:MAG: TipAS antibiotic-recognition domain-containing protein [Defluviitaleaceae bacterium]|nr:TipAS antibiotic-recognition domain-containing protein [Defluviitaleaceae bacterium]
MTDKERIDDFAQRMIAENEQKYGAEIRQKYGGGEIDDSNAYLASMTEEQFEKSEAIRIEFEKTLLAAFNEGDPSGELAQKACELHKQWLCVFYSKYTKEYHLGLAAMYVADERFGTNYEKLAVGCTQFLHDAINIFCR